MTITLPKELAKRLHSRASEEGVSVEALLEDLLDEEWDEDSEADESDDGAISEIRAAIDESLQQFERGESLPADVVFGELRKRHGIPD